MKIGKKAALFIDSKMSRFSTIVLRGVKSAAEEATRALHDSFAVLRFVPSLHHHRININNNRNVMREPKVVYGGGVCETKASVYLENKALNERSPFIASIIKSFAESLMEIPFTLALNCGFDANQIISELLSNHRKSLSTYVFYRFLH